MVLLQNTNCSLKLLPQRSRCLPFALFSRHFNLYFCTMSTENGRKAIEEKDKKKKKQTDNYDTHNIS